MYSCVYSTSTALRSHALYCGTSSLAVPNSTCALQPSALVRTCYHSTGTALREIPGGDVDGTGPTRTGTEVDDSEKGCLYIYS